MGRRKSRTAFEHQFTNNAALYGRVKLCTLPTPPDWNRLADIAPNGGTDVVLTFRTIHD